MFHATSKLPHLLSPDWYHSSASFEHELRSVSARSWHLAGTTSELSRPGDYITRIVAGIPIQVRNFGGEIKALSNVCAHRHALICSSPCGHSAKMQCQYHGWEYQSDGATGRIPQPKNFTPIDRESQSLPSYHAEQVGQLVFVNVSDSPEPLRTFLGEEFADRLADRFGEDWSLSLKWEPDYDVNWKIPVENSLESYHVPNVHPSTFREDPGGERTEHHLHDRRTSMATSLPFSPHNRLDGFFQSLESRFVNWLGHSPTGRYEQHHVFPNVLFSFTDAISLVNCVIPSGPKKSYAVVRQFGLQPTSVGRVKRSFARGWSRMTAAITRRILLEDIEIYEAIQMGLEHSQQAGVLGICEERIHRFQEFVKDACDESLQTLGEFNL